MQIVDIRIPGKYILIKQPVTPTNKRRVIFAMCIIHMDPFFITNLEIKCKSSVIGDMETTRKKDEEKHNE